MSTYTSFAGPVRAARPEDAPQSGSADLIDLNAPRAASWAAPVAESDPRARLSRQYHRVTPIIPTQAGPAGDTLGSLLVDGSADVDRLVDLLGDVDPREVEDYEVVHLLERVAPAMTRLRTYLGGAPAVRVPELLALLWDVRSTGVNRG